MARDSTSNIVDEMVVLQRILIVCSEILAMSLHYLTYLNFFFKGCQHHSGVHAGVNRVFTLGPTEDEHNCWQHGFVFEQFNYFWTGRWRESSRLFTSALTRAAPNLCGIRQQSLNVSVWFSRNHSFKHLTLFRSVVEQCKVVDKFNGTSCFYNYIGSSAYC